VFRSAPPRFVVRTTVATLLTVAVVLSAVFLGVTINVRDRVRSTVAEKLELGQRMLSALELRRARELSVQVTTLAENPTLKAALDTYQSEIDTANAASRTELLDTIDRELEKLAARVGPDVLVVTDPSGRVLAAAGRFKSSWESYAGVQPHADGSGYTFVSAANAVFQFASAPLALQDTEIGTLHLARVLDTSYAEELSALSGTSTLIASGSQILTSTLEPELLKAIAPSVLNDLPASGIVDLAGSEHAVKLLFANQGVAVYALDSIEASTKSPMQRALAAVLIIAILSFALAAVGPVLGGRPI
jgi:hypothetical protein